MLHSFLSLTTVAVTASLDGKVHFAQKLCQCVNLSTFLHICVSKVVLVCRCLTATHVTVLLEQPVPIVNKVCQMDNTLYIQVCYNALVKKHGML